MKINLVINLRIFFFFKNIIKDTFSSYLMPDYEKHSILEYTNGGDEKLIFGNTNEPKILEITKSIVKIYSQLTFFFENFLF